MNSRTVAVTSNVFKEYKDLITNTTSDLEDHLKEIETKLEELSLQGSSMSDEDIAERERVLEEKESTKQCLIICAQVSEHIGHVQPLAFEDVSAAQSTHQVIATRLKSLASAKKLTSNTLKECKERLTDTTMDLERHLQRLEIKLRALSLKGGSLTNEDAAELEWVQEEKESIKQCLSICADASQQVNQPRTNVFGDVSVGRDGQQVIVATLGDLISAKKVTAGDRGTQWLGQMSDLSLQQLSRARRIEKYGSPPTEEETRSRAGSDAAFEGSYGAGYKLK